METVEFVGRPHEQHKEEHDRGLDFVGFETAEFLIGALKRLTSAREFRLFVLLSERKDKANADQIGEDAKAHHQRKTRAKPVKIKNRNAGAGKEGNTEEIGARPRHERVAGGVDHE